MYSTHRPPNDPDSFLFDLDEHYEQPTVFDNNIFADWLSEDPVTHATSQAQSISIPSHSPIVPPSSSVALASSLAFPQPTPLSTSPFTYNPLRQEFFDTQYSRSSDDVSSYDNQFLSAYSHNLPAPVWAANLWDNQTDGSIIHGEQFSFQPPATGAFDPSFVLSRESSPNDVLDAPPSPSSATRAQPYPVGRQGVQADHTAFLPSAPPTIIPLSEPYYRSPTPSRSYSRRAQSVTSDESAGDRDATIRRLSKRSQQSRGEFRSTPDKFSSETPSSPQKSMFRPPKLAPSAWQLYFTDWIQRFHARSTKKLNVAQAAKEAGQDYANLSADEKEPYKRQAQAAKDARERELNEYKRIERLDRVAVYQDRTRHLKEAKRDLGVFEKAYHSAECDIREREARSERELRALRDRVRLLEVAGLKVAGLKVAKEGGIDHLATHEDQGQLLEEAQRDLEVFKRAYYNAEREIRDLEESFEQEKQALSDEIRRLREHELHCHEGRFERTIVYQVTQCQCQGQYLDEAKRDLDALKKAQYKAECDMRHLEERFEREMGSANNEIRYLRAIVAHEKRAVNQQIPSAAPADTRQYAAVMEGTKTA